MFRQKDFHLCLTDIRSHHDLHQPIALSLSLQYVLPSLAVSLHLQSSYPVRPSSSSLFIISLPFSRNNIKANYIKFEWNVLVLVTVCWNVTGATQGQKIQINLCKRQHAIMLSSFISLLYWHRECLHILSFGSKTAVASYHCAHIGITSGHLQMKTWVCQTSISIIGHRKLFSELALFTPPPFFFSFCLALHSVFSGLQTLTFGL